jgi:hypothetical protein
MAMFRDIPLPVHSSCQFQGSWNRAWRFGRIDGPCFVRHSIARSIASNWNGTPSWKRSRPRTSFTFWRLGLILPFPLPSLHGKSYSHAVYIAQLERVLIRSVSIHQFFAHTQLRRRVIRRRRGNNVIWRLNAFTSTRRRPGNFCRKSSQRRR